MSKISTIFFIVLLSLSFITPVCSKVIGEYAISSKYKHIYTKRGGAFGTVHRYAVNPNTHKVFDKKNILNISTLKNGNKLITNKQAILINSVVIRAYNLPKNELSADQCIYVKSMGVDPGPTELGCKASRFKERGEFRLAINYPVGVYLPKNSTLGCALAINSYNYSWNSEDLGKAKISCKINYTIYKPNMPFGQIVRIPYLDSISRGPNLIPPGVWYRGKNLNIRGMQVFYGVMSLQHDSKLKACIVLTDNKGLKTRECAPEVSYRSNQKSFDPPSFKFLNLNTQQGTISAECTMKANNGNDSHLLHGDCAIYLLLLRSGSTPPPKSISTLYHNNVFSNRHFLKYRYCKTLIYDYNQEVTSTSKIKSGITPAGQSVLDVSIRSATLRPWSLNKKYENTFGLSETGKKRVTRLNRWKACLRLFNTGSFLR